MNKSSVARWRYITTALTSFYLLAETAEHVPLLPAIFCCIIVITIAAVITAVYYYSDLLQAATRVNADVVIHCLRQTVEGLDTQL